MNVFKKLFGNNNSAANEMKTVIECVDNIISINGTEITFPTNLDMLIKLFGEPSKSMRTKSTRSYIECWDALGIYCNCATYSYIYSVGFLISSKNHHLELAPKRLFSGVLKVNGKLIDHENLSTIKLEKVAITKVQWKGEDSPYAFSVGINFDYKEEIPKDKYTIKPINEEIIEFKDFNFKLAIIQELMYHKDLLQPKFDLYEFVEWYQERDIDIEKEGYEAIPEVTQYFKDLPILKSLAKEVTEIYQDGGNEIYIAMLRFGEGDEDYWDIESTEDAKHFPNLKKVILCYAKENIMDDFNKVGIKASWL